MATISNTVGPPGTGGTVNVGAREDLEDFIYRVSPEETPFVNNVGSIKCKAIRHEWQIEALAAPSSTNYHLEGDDLGTTYSAGNIPTRVSNINQIFEKDGIVSRTQGVLDLAGAGALPVLQNGRIKPLDTAMGLRVAYVDALGAGLTAAETADAQARAEVQALIAEVCAILA